jgi:ribosomal protein L29
MKASELRNQSIEELHKLERELAAELFVIRGEMRLTDQPKQPHRIEQKRRLRARTLTVLREKQTQKISETQK